MTRYSDTLRDQFERPITGATIYVYTDEEILANLEEDGGGILANPITSDEYGNFYFNAPTGFYILDFFVGGRKVLRQENIAIGGAEDSIRSLAQDVVNRTTLTVTGAAGQSVATRGLLAGISGPVGEQSAYLAESGREGFFIWQSGNYSAEVTGDPLQGIFVPPASDTTGASGAWVRVDAHALNVKWFGAKGDTVLNSAGGVVSGTDDTTAIQNAINYAVSLGVAKLFFPDGVYQVTKLTLPEYAIAGDTAIKIVELAGPAHPSTLYGTIGTAPISTKGAVIKSAAAGDAVIRALPSGGSFSGYHLVVRDLTIRTYDNPTISGLDARYCQQLTVFNLAVDTGVYPVDASNPTTGVHGVITPRGSNGAINRIQGLNVSGYFAGMEANEHTSADDINFWCCKYAVEFLVANHPSHFRRVGIYRCTNGLLVNGIHYFDIEQLSIEHANEVTQVTNPADLTQGNGWQVTDKDIVDPSNYGRGKVKWFVTKGDVGADTTFARTGGQYISTSRVGVELPPIRVFGDALGTLNVPSATITYVPFTTATDFLESGVAINGVDNTVIDVLEDGFYELSFSGQFSASATGRRELLIYKGPDVVGATVVQPVSGSATTFQVSNLIVGATAGSNFRVVAYQDSGGVLTLTRGLFSGNFTIRRLTRATAF